MKQLQASFGKLNLHDIAKGFVLALITAILTPVVDMTHTGSFPVDWNSWSHILEGAGTVAGSYLIKNLLTNKDDQFLKRDISK